MARTEITANFYQLVLNSLKRQVANRLHTECQELAEKIIADEIAKLTFSVEDLVSIEAGGKILRIEISRENKNRPTTEG